MQCIIISSSSDRKCIKIISLKHCAEFHHSGTPSIITELRAVRHNNAIASNIPLRIALPGPVTNPQTIMGVMGCYVGLLLFFIHWPHFVLSANTKTKQKGIRIRARNAIISMVVQWCGAVRR